MLYKLNAKSSDGTSAYTVEFNWDGNKLEIFCDCRAGLLGQHCRHKDGLISGDHTLLADPSASALLNEVVSLVKISQVGVVLGQLREAEDRLKAAQVEVKLAKKALEKVMRPR
jgi:hypothetical protein